MNKRILLKAPAVVLLLALPVFFGVFTDSSAAAPAGDSGKGPEIAPIVVHEFGLTVFLARDDKSYPECVSAGPGFVHGSGGEVSGYVAGTWEAADSAVRMPDKPTMPPDKSAVPVGEGGRSVPGEPSAPVDRGDGPRPVIVG